jgi:error-prone DNA polymerase
VIFITIEDETGIANLVVWSSLFDRQRRIVLSASMLECRGRVQREGDVIHVVAEELEDLSSLLRSVGGRQQPFPVQRGTGDGVTHQNGPDPREAGSMAALLDARRPADRDVGIRVQTRSFR